MSLKGQKDIKDAIYSFWDNRNYEMSPLAIILDALSFSPLFEVFKLKN
jgi:hypothetical protein